MVKLPAAWKTDLRQRLSEAEPEQWAAIIDSEQRKADAAGHKPQVNVKGAGVQTAAAPIMEADRNPLPLPGENVEDWQRRMALNNGRN